MKRLLFLVLLVFWAIPPAAAVAEIKVLASAAPIHSLIAGVMAGVGSPELIVKSTASPDNYRLTPAAAARIAKADLIFMVGPGLENSLLKPIAVLAKKARVVILAEAPGVRLAAPRGENNARQTYDFHIWLDPANARAIVLAAVGALSKADPANAASYTTNGRKLDRRLATLERDLRRRLAPLGRQPFLVYHNAFAYLERAFGLEVAGSLAGPAGAPMSARRVARLRALIRSRRIRCLFLGPLQSSNSVRALTDGLDVSLGVLDPLGMGMEPGPELYFRMMENLARALEGCLSPAG